jgi:hypothetical protein
MTKLFDLAAQQALDASQSKIKIKISMAHGGGL